MFHFLIHSIFEKKTSLTRKDFSSILTKTNKQVDILINAQKNPADPHFFSFLCLNISPVRNITAYVLHDL
jgi:hypothetical protein